MAARLIMYCVALLEAEERSWSKVAWDVISSTVVIGLVGCEVWSCSEGSAVIEVVACH